MKLSRIFVCILLMILLVGTASALEIDNVRDYNEETQTVTITNWLGLGDIIATVKLNTPLINKVGLGYQKVFEFTINTFGDYEEALKEIEYFNKVDMSDKEIQLDLKYKDVRYEEVTYTDCVMDFKTGKETCIEKTEEQKIIEYKDYISKDMLEGEITLSGWTDVKEGDYVEFIPTWFGERMDEFASWDAGLNVGLEGYFAFEEGTGTNAVESIFGLKNLTLFDGLGWNMTGIIGNSSGEFDNTGDFLQTSDPTYFNATNDTSFSYCFWNYPKDVETEGHLISRGLNDFEIISYITDIYIETTGGGQCNGNGGTIGVWNYICVTYNGTENNNGVGLYVNGAPQALIGTGDALPAFDNSNNLTIGAQISPNAYFITGWLDEIGIWNRSLTQTEITQLYNGGVGMTFTDDFSSPPEVTLVNPDDYANLTSNTITLNYSVIDNSNITSVLLYINGTLNKTTDWGTSNTTGIISTELSFPDGMYEWNVTALDNESLQGNSTLRYFTIDSTAPTINITEPAEIIDYWSSGENLTINFTASDTYLDSCWYSWDSGTTNRSLVSCLDLNFTANITSASNNSVMFWANDSSNNVASSSRTWDYRLFFLNETYVASTTEGATNEFRINFETNGSSINVGRLNYNNTNYTGSISSVGNVHTLTRDIFAPSVASSTNMPFYWIITMGDYQKDMTSKNQTVNSLVINETCGAGMYMVYNFTLLDEITQAEINETAENSSIKVNADLYTADRSILMEEFSYEFSRINPAAFCMDSNLSGGEEYLLDVIIEYGSLNYSTEFYNIENYNLTETSMYQNISLFHLSDSATQEFKLIVRDNAFLALDDALVQIERYYIENGTHNITEIPRTDAKGETSASLQLNEVLYNFYIYVGGELISQFLDVRAICHTPAISECKIELNDISDPINVPDYTEDDIEFNITYNETSKIVEVPFDIGSGEPSEMTLIVTQEDAISTSVCTDTLTSATGTLTCTVPNAFGNCSIRATVYKNGIWKGWGAIKLETSPSDIYGGVLTILAVLVIMTLIGVGVSDNPVVTGVMLLVGVIFLFSMNLVQNNGLIGVGATFLYFAIAIILVIIKAARRN